MADNEQIKSSGLRSEIESCAFLNFLEASAIAIGWKNSRRDAVEIDHVYEAMVSHHQNIPSFIEGKVVRLEMSMRSLVMPKLKNVLDLTKIRIIG